jgi:hypothetical protein
VIGCRLLRRHLVDSDELEQPAFEHRHRAERRIAQASRVGDDRIKNRLHVSWVRQQ